MAGPLKILVLCSRNRWRCPTAERLYRVDPRVAVRSAGVAAGAVRRLGRRDLQRADAVMAMERAHRRAIRDAFPDLAIRPIVVLDVPDDYRLVDVELQELLRRQIEPELEVLLDRREPSAGNPEQR